MRKRKNIPLSFCIINIIRLIIFFLAVLVTVSGAVHAQEQKLTKIVEVIGKGTIQGDNVVAAKEQAISSSLVSAVKLATEELLPLESAVRDFRTLNKILYDHTDKFVQEYKVLTEQMDGNQYSVLVQVRVSIDKVKELLSSAEIIQGKKTMPKVLFFIAEQNLEDISPMYWWGEGMAFVKGFSENAMAEIMRKEGFSVIDHGAMVQNRRVEAVKNKPDLDNQEAVGLGAHLQADVVIVGKSIAHKSSNAMGSDIGSFKGTLTAFAYLTDSGEEIGSTIRTTVTANADEITGGRDALSRVGIFAGEDLASQIIAAWQKKIHGHAMVKVIVEGTRNLRNFVMFRRIINDMRGVNGIQVTEINPDEATLIVDFQGNAKMLADALILKSFESFGIDIFTVSRNHLRIELIPTRTSSIRKSLKANSDRY